MLHSFFTLWDVSHSEDLTLLGALYFAYLKIEDKLELTTNSQETRLVCYAKVGNQPNSIVGSYQKLIPAASKSPPLNVGVQYPPYTIVNGDKVAIDQIDCIAEELCKVIVIFSGT